MQTQMIAAAALALSLTAGAATAGETADIAMQSCLNELQMPQAICTCIATSAEEELNPAEQQFFIAMITSDNAAAANLRNTMTVGEMTNVATFMSDTPQACAMGQK